MIEFLKHFTGACGEGHPSVLWLILSGSPVIGYIIYTIREYLKNS